MNKEESLALFAQGKDAWNAWAAEMLEKRKALEASGEWTPGGTEFDWNDATRTWHAAAKTEFSEHQFKEMVDFSGFVFPGVAWFDGATFSDRARFYGTTFLGHARFQEATFSSYSEFTKVKFRSHASFGRATFLENTGFSGATFSGDAEFSETTFSSEAKFLQAVFEGFTEFDGTRFKDAADFRAIEGKSVFSLAGATFLAVPNFIQAHFAEAPRLDNSRIQPRHFRLLTMADVKNYFKGDRDLPARWRALKRLAVQGHDHMHELEFFQNELKTRRWSTDRPWQAVFWFGLFYSWFSDFGRSIFRPLLWWAVSAVVFWQLYLVAHFDRTEKPFSVFGWSIDRFVLQPLCAAVAPQLHCLAGSGDPWWAAFWISARKALLIFGLDSSDKLTQKYACLYGVITQQPAPSGQLPASFYLDVPNSVIGLGSVQHIFSAVMLFLCLLAIRNHFRIK